MFFTEILKEYEDFVSAKGASDDSIKKAEDELGLIFSEDYRDYLRECGIASADGHEFTGITPSERLNVVSVTLSARNNMDDPPRNLYVVERLQIDGIIIWQSSEGKIYKTVRRSTPEMIGNSMMDYLKG